MPRFAQHTKLIAASGKRDELIAKFLDAIEIQRGNPACEVMLVSVATDASDVVYLTEVWSSTEEWENARSSDKIRAWAASMPGLVDGPPETEPLEVVGGKGLRHSLTGPNERGAT
jgi:quinol monooxygenase YgiN